MSSQTAFVYGPPGWSVSVTGPDEDLLARLKVEWEDHKMTMGMIRDILMYYPLGLLLSYGKCRYMDRNYVRQHPEQCVPVYDMGLRVIAE